MSFDFGELAKAAVKNNYSSKTPLYELPVEKARAFVKSKDGNRKPAENGSQALVLTLGRFNLDLSIIAPGATRVFAPEEQIEHFTGILQAAIDSGAFDDEIIAAQLKSNPAEKLAEDVEQDVVDKVLEAVQELPQAVDIIEDDLNAIDDDDDLTLVDQNY